MKRLAAKLTVPSLFLFLTLLGAGALLAADGAPGKPSPIPLLLDRITAQRHPGNAVPGSTAQRRAALASLTPAQRQEYLRRFAAKVGPALQAAAQAHGAPHFVRADRFGQAIRSTSSGAAGAGSPAGAPAFILRPGKKGVDLLTKIAYSGADDDGDGLPDDFENAVADGFTPLYGVSTGEQAGTGFARFGDYVPQTVIQNLPAVPPTSHFRVTPLGFANDNTGRQYGFLQIDYLTFWNRDDGLQIGGDCRFYASVLGGLIGYGIADVLDGLQSHDIDDERSAALVAAPTPAPNQYSTDPDTYQAYQYYTAAHEGTFFDHSAFLTPPQPVPVYNHLNLALSQAKHGTYTFNPDGFPLFPGWVIDTTYSTISFLYFDGEIDDYDYLIYSGMADALFYSCVVEHFGNQGGFYADPRINVGELSHPLNGSGFILDSEPRSKLSPTIWQIQ